MPSPFPGMSPYLEQDDAWHGFHRRFLPAAAEILGAQLIPSYIVKIGEYVYVHDIPESDRRLVGWADLSIGSSTKHTRQLQSTELLESPAQLELPELGVERVSHIEILDRRSRELITVIELLSPSNKRPGRDRER